MTRSTLEKGVERGIERAIENGFGRFENAFENAFEIGFAIGFEIGSAMGRTELLLIQLAEKFGPVSLRSRKRVEFLSAAEARKFGLKLVRANSLKELGL